VFVFVWVGGWVGTRGRSQDNAKRRSLDSTAIVFGTPKGGKLNQERLQSLYGDCIKLANEVRLPSPPDSLLPSFTCAALDARGPRALCWARGGVECGVGLEV
jgi:hypothetical protein